MIKVKVCGITNQEDALAAVEYGADALGFVFAPSPRKVDPETVARIVSALPQRVVKVGVFVDAPLEQVAKTLRECRLDLAQLHGKESPEDCAAIPQPVIKAFVLRTDDELARLAEYNVAGYLIDRAKTATGETAKTQPNWRLAYKATKYGSVLLAGGLTPNNVIDAINSVQPYAVDVASGVEVSPGKKDHQKMRAFIERVKTASYDHPEHIGPFSV
jgi:phosphoribosylanthranilate isomerase